MKITPDDPRISAYLLGELGPAEAAEIERAAAADPAIRLSLDEMRRTTAFLDGLFGAGEAALHPAQREAILRAGRDADATGKVVELKSARQGGRSWLAGLGAAAAVVVAALVMSRLGSEGDGGLADSAEGGSTIALLPLPGPAHGDGASTHGGAGGDRVEAQARALQDRPGEYLSEVAKQLESGPLPEPGRLPATGEQAGFADPGRLRLPVVVGTASLRWIESWVREKGALPPRNAVRVEELVNASALPRSGGEGGLELRAIGVECPWEPANRLVAVQIGSSSELLRGVVLHAECGTPARLLGSFGRQRSDSLPDVLPAGRSTLLMLEVVAGDDSSVTLEAEREGEVVARVSPEAGDGPALRHAALMAGFGLWLRAEGVSASRLERTLAWAEEGDSDPVRADARRVVRQALQLAQAGR